MNTIIKIKDRFNKNKTWVIKYTQCRHYHITQEIGNDRLYPFHRVPMDAINSMLGIDIKSLIKAEKEATKAANAVTWFEATQETKDRNVNFSKLSKAIWYRDHLGYTIKEALGLVKVHAKAFIEMIKKGYTVAQLKILARG